MAIINTPEGSPAGRIVFLRTGGVIKNRLSYAGNQLIV